MTTLPADTVCCVCGHDPANLLWDVDTGERYCADPNACRARAAGQEPETGRDHGRCEQFAVTQPGYNPVRCIRDTRHTTPHRDHDGHEWA